MKLKDYAEKIKALSEKYPEVDVVYSADDEGNEFKKVYYHPTAGNFDGLYYLSTSEEPEAEVNSICIN